MQITHPFISDFKLSVARRSHQYVSIPRPGVDDVIPIPQCFVSFSFCAFVVFLFCWLRCLVEIRKRRESWCVNDCCSSVKIKRYTSQHQASRFGVEFVFYFYNDAIASPNTDSFPIEHIIVCWKFMQQWLRVRRWKVEKNVNLFAFFARGFSLCRARRHSFEWNCFVI